MKVWISVHGRFHGFDLARELNRAGILAGVSTTYPARFARRWLPAPIVLRTAPSLEAVRRLAAIARCAALSELWIAQSFARFASVHSGTDIDVLVGWSGASLEAIPVAHAQGIRVVIERGSSHIRHQARILRNAYEEFGLPRQAVDPRMVEREVEEYAAADAIAVPSSYAASTFSAFGIPAERLIVNPYGADLVRFAPLPVPTERPRPRILFVGSIGLRKGVPWLLRAFSPLANEADLHLVGPIEPGMASLLAHESTKNVEFRGALRTPHIERAFQEADIFCLPSLEEGFPLAMLQAMASGLPIVVTPETGAADIVEPGREGIIVPSRDPAALCEALSRLVRDKDARQAMGAAARARVAAGYGWSDYGSRAVAAYRKLLADRAEFVGV